jgi:zinc protease
MALPLQRVSRRPFGLLLASLWGCASLAGLPVRAEFLTDKPATASNNPPPAELDIPSLTNGVSRTELANGLTVLTKEVHTAPVVAVQVWYKVGSADETVGNNGISHQLEHLMFKGTHQRPVQFGRLFNAIGSDSNAFTTFDTTAYVSTVGRDYLDTILTLEADRMTGTQITDATLASEKRVVISELQGYENSPSYRLNRALQRSLFPDPGPDTPAYNLPIGGTRADVEQFTTKQVQDYYRQHYGPDRAVLVVVGDFETDAALKTIRRTFGRLQPTNNPVAADRTAIAASTPTEAIRLQEPGSLSLLQMAYPIPALDDPDVASLDLLSAVLSSGRSSRLFRQIVQPGLAAGAGANTMNLRGAGWYQMSASATPDQSLSAIEQAMEAELQKLQDQPVDPTELARVKRQLLAGTILGYRDVSSQASQLGYDEAVAGDYHYSDRYLRAAAAVTPADIQRVARQYLTSERRHIGYFEPTRFVATNPDSLVGTETTAEQPASDPIAAPAELANIRQYLPVVASSAQSQATRTLPQKVTLPNGLKLLLLPDRSAPVVTLVGEVEAGSGFDAAAKAGVAALTADTVTSGTRDQSALEFASTLESIGASLGFSAHREGVDFGGAALAQDLPILANQLAAALQAATFPQSELELTRKRSLASLQATLDDPSSVALRTFQSTLFPEGHPYHAMTSPTSLKAIRRRDVQAFYRQHYRPDTTTLALVGDFDPDAAKELFSALLGNWSAPGQPPQLNFPSVAPLTASQRQRQQLAGKSQSVTLLGQLGISRLDPTYETALLLNDVIGGNTLSSRLGLEIRDRQGLTYGIYSGFQTGKGVGPFLVSMQTNPDDVQRAVDSTLSLLQEIADKGITAAELELSRSSLVNQYPVGLADPDAVAQAFLQREVLGLSLEDLYDFPRKLQAIELEEVNQLAQTLLHPEAMLVVTAGP